MAAAKKVHTVQPGEHLVRIALDEKRRRYRPIWDANPEVSSRIFANPNILFTGDTIVIGEVKAKKLPAQTEKRNHFVVQSPDKVDLFVVLKDEDNKPIAGMDCEYPIAKAKAASDGDGKLEVLDIKPTLELGVLEFKYKTLDLSTRGVDPDPDAPPPPTPPDPEFEPDEPPDPKPSFPEGAHDIKREFTLGVGLLDPLSTTEGVQERLSNLGYYVGDVGYADEDPQALDLAIEEFLVDHDSKANPDKSSLTMLQKLKDEHGC